MPRQARRAESRWAIPRSWAHPTRPAPSIIGRVTSAARPPADPSDHRSRARGLAGDPERRAIVPASWALYDFANTIFSFAVVSGAIGLYLVDRFGERDGNACCPSRSSLSVGINALVSPILGAFSDRGPGRMPFLLFFTAAVHRRDVLHREPRRRSLGLVLFIVANFAYQAALIYYDATLKTVSYPATRGQAVRARDRDRLLRDGLRRAPDLLPRRAGRRPVPAHGHPVPGLRDPDLRVRARAADRRAEGRDRRRDPGRLRAAAPLDRARPRGAGPRAVPPRPVLLLRRGQHGHRGHEHRGVQTMGLSDAERQPRPAAADRRRDRDELRVGRAGGPAGPEEDAGLGPRLVGGRAGARRGRDRVRAGRARARSSSPGRSSDRGWAASRSRTAC